MESEGAWGRPHFRPFFSASGRAQGAPSDLVRTPTKKPASSRWANSSAALARPRRRHWRGRTRPSSAPHSLQGRATTKKSPTKGDDHRRGPRHPPTSSALSIVASAEHLGACRPASRSATPTEHHLSRPGREISYASPSESAFTGRRSQGHLI